MRKNKVGRPIKRPHKIQEIEDLDKLGYSVSEIARALEMPRMTVHYHLKKLSTGIAQ